MTNEDRVVGFTVRESEPFSLTSDSEVSENGSEQCVPFISRLLETVEDYEKMKDSGGVILWVAGNLLGVNRIRKPRMKEGGFHVEVHDFIVMIIGKG